MRHGFLPGDELVQASTGLVLYVVERTVPRIQRLKAIDLVSREECLLDEAELRPQVAAGEIRVRRKGVEWGEGLSHTSAADLPAHEAHQAAMRLLRDLMQLRRKYGVSFNKAYDLLVTEVLPERGEDPANALSRAQAYRLRNRDRNGLPLHRGNAAKGNRTPRYAPEAVDLVVDLAKTHYLKVDSPWGIDTITEVANQRLHEARLLPRSREMSKNYVQRVIRTHVHADPEHARMHPHDAIAAKAVARRKIRIAQPFERVEQDGVHLPFVLRTPHGDSNNVWLVHAIDCCTSMVLGWCLVIGSPRVASTLKCIETILFPKRGQFERLGINCEFDIYGVPALLVVDNGPENKGERILGLSKLSIDVDNLQARHPHCKPFIERLNRSLKEYLETLPGSTRKDGKDGQRDPVALGDPVMTLEEMERWIVRFYFEHWANHPLKRLVHSLFTEGEGLGSTPAKRFLTLTVERGYPIPLPPSLDAWRSVVYEQLLKPLSRKSGIAYKNYEFKGDRLSHLIDRFGETEVRVLVDRDDFRVVYVVDRDGRTLIPLINTSTDEFTPAFSFDQAEAMLKAASDEGVDMKSAALRRDVLNRSMEVGIGGKGRKRAGGQGAVVAKPAVSKQTTQRARQSEAVQRSANHPLPPLGLGVGQPALGTEEDEWDSAPALALFDRHTGASRP